VGCLRLFRLPRCLPDESDVFALLLAEAFNLLLGLLADCWSLRHGGILGGGQLCRGFMRRAKGLGLTQTRAGVSLRVRRRRVGRDPAGGRGGAPGFLGFVIGSLGDFRRRQGILFCDGTLAFAQMVPYVQPQFRPTITGGRRRHPWGRPRAGHVERSAVRPLSLGDI